MSPNPTDADLAQLLDALLPPAEGERLPMPRFGRTTPPPAQPLPTACPPNAALEHGPPVPLQWVDDDLGIRVLIEYQTAAGATAIWADVVANDPGLAGKSVSVALVSATGDRFIGRLIPLEGGADKGCTGRLRFGTVDEVRARLGNDRVTLDVFLME